jgi:hypothetical protein
VQAVVLVAARFQLTSTDCPLGTVTLRDAAVYPLFVAVTVYVPALSDSR